MCGTQISKYPSVCLFSVTGSQPTVLLFRGNDVFFNHNCKISGLELLVVFHLVNEGQGDSQVMGVKAYLSCSAKWDCYD